MYNGNLFSRIDDKHDNDSVATMGGYVRVTVCELPLAWTSVSAVHLDLMIPAGIAVLCCIY